MRKKHLKAVIGEYNARNRKSMSPYELMHELYEKRHLSAAEIGKRHLLVSKALVYRFLRELGIQVRKTKSKGGTYRGYQLGDVIESYNARNGKCIPAYEVLDDLYNKRRLSCEAIGLEHLFVSKMVVLRFLKEAGIKIRPKGNAAGKVARTERGKLVAAISPERLEGMYLADIRRETGIQNSSYLCHCLRSMGLKWKMKRGQRVKKETVYPKTRGGHGLGAVVDSRA